MGLDHAWCPFSKVVLIHNSSSSSLYILISNSLSKEYDFFIISLGSRKIRPCLFSSPAGYNFSRLDSEMDNSKLI